MATVIYKMRWYCLTRMGFGLNVASAVMKALIDTALVKDESIELPFQHILTTYLAMKELHPQHAQDNISMTFDWCAKNRNDWRTMPEYSAYNSGRSMTPFIKSVGVRYQKELELGHAEKYFLLAKNWLDTFLFVDGSRLRSPSLNPGQLRLHPIGMMK